MTELPLVTAAEHDALTKWRRWLCYTQYAGVCASIKRQYRRRCRRNEARVIAEGMADGGDL